ncbi:MAG TPA: sn-glycerol-3-phosphate ABC transporter ATP-binding protein UgpC [Firmicutes bacterium]|nr:aBC transporter related [Clostridium sp. CAG:288]HAR48303.1 sn-glycerol-3-phosphate ABC transporter ATP-binding protein UgpC [Bacillota bacterium]HAX00115.1 sn-glycerol-3-phosphate ABC transporter ATP-binding protein UgpC [Bacillota bacterium]
MATLKFNNICKVYGKDTVAVKDFNLEVKDHEFIVFVGPSGCGKSTTLRMLAGLEEISSGELYIDDVLINDVQPKKRDIAMVFQSYALYPHMTVYENMAFALKIRKIPKAEIDERVKEVASILGLTEYLNRKPKALSGGQCQRVALGRAIVRRPKVFLMDEPLSNLDAKLRVTMREEIIRIHEKVGATTIYVTHDQTEAMTMASRIVIMKTGIVQQIGTPKEVYSYPANTFVAQFIGSPSMNLFNGSYDNGKFTFDGTNSITIDIPKEHQEKLKDYSGKQLIVGIRPEDISLDPAMLKKYSHDTISIDSQVVELLGHDLVIYSDVDGQKIIVKTLADYDIKAHQDVKVAICMNKIHYFDPDTTNRIEL